MAVLESLHQVQNRSTQWPLPAENYICGGGKNIDADRSRASGIWACLRMKDLQTAYLFCMEHPELQASGVLIFFQYLLRHAIAVPAIVITLRNMSDAKHHPASITQHKLFSNRMMV